ncbi:TPA: adenine nucleotide alpha hydrolase [Vibrio parahaemolyticus]|uniref:adenine nucleotide alpha hydrolase n=1 Tax=Vibrio parahaemolyticus TaxID=670 RepID=UPI0011210F89|nr:adenine nucleotide alpha hydrolase [Vibrio parahaemolyticus]EHZ2540128.1 adenine nucleotide alpha hydrolase [Vibrio parahaemolyticus]MBE5191367.1 adenine nucleotide alpha hydrolase [Vibrio parahaemolyticus]TOJ95266.1 ATPase [Vibrio parahaemolyticus]HCE1551958.1 adenine nucleotide alpha hydrolase [Vibrio parahaemolyticus]HCG5125374.1 adenine nucleotide alpha hydrolase [Vibrio parahaemolyticus]
MTKPKRVVISWSSGKDSTLTLERLNENPNYQVVGLYTTCVGKEVPFQATPLGVVQMQADLLDLPLITIELPEVFPSNDIYQSAIVNALQSSGLNVEAVAFGDMFCNGIADYRRSYIEPAGWECVFPLLGENSLSLAMEVIERGIQAMLITIDGSVLSPEWCGRWYDQVLIESLPRHIDPCGENGEFHTLVTSTPSFQGHIELIKLEVEIGERFSHQRYRAKALPKQI